MDECPAVVHHVRMGMNWEALAEEVRRSRQEQGLNMLAFAKKAEISRMSLHALEQGEKRSRVPSILPKVEEALGWPQGRGLAILEGRDPRSDQPATTNLPDELARSIEHVVIATRGDMTAAEIRDLTQRVLDDLRERGAI